MGKLHYTNRTLIKILQKQIDGEHLSEEEVWDALEYVDKKAQLSVRIVTIGEYQDWTQFEEGPASYYQFLFYQCCERKLHALAWR